MNAFISGWVCCTEREPEVAGLRSPRVCPRGGFGPGAASRQSKGGVLEGGLGYIHRSKVQEGGPQVVGGGCYKMTLI